MSDREHRLIMEAKAYLFQLQHGRFRHPKLYDIHEMFKNFIEKDAKEISEEFYKAHIFPIQVEAKKVYSSHQLLK